jgi:tRNA modification GTPase
VDLAGYGVPGQAVGSVQLNEGASSDGLDSTIAAIATAPGAAGVGVIRVSGSKAWQIAQRLFSKSVAMVPGRFYHGWIHDPESPETLIDEVLLLVFKAPHSFTGEDVIEIHGHGSDVVCQQVLQLCLAQGARHAEPGEFTKRAFLNGKIDLTQAESVMDLVSAQSTAQARLATANLKNRSLSQQLQELYTRLVTLQAPIVASIDFPDEVDEPDRNQLAQQLRTESQWVGDLLARAQKNQVARQGYRVVLLGRPNAGKSALFNALLAQDRAIVTDIPGTTRDVLTEGFDLDGVRVTLVDTAGIRDSDSHIEVLGMARTWMALDEANAALYVVDASQGLTAEDTAVLSRLTQQSVALVANKSDLLASDSPPPAWASVTNQLPVVRVSAQTGQGLSAIYQWIQLQIQQTGLEVSQGAIALNARQQDCLQQLARHLQSAASTAGQSTMPLDMVTVPLTDALRQIDQILGNDPTEAVLDSVFAQFCVGK